MPTPPRLRLPTGELVCSGSLLAVGAFVVLYGLRYPLIANGVLGPGFMPTVTGTVLAVISVIAGWQALQSARKAAEAPGAAPEAGGKKRLSLKDFAEDEGEAARRPLKVVGIMAMLVLSALLADVLGLIPLLGVLVFACVAVLERESVLIAALMAVGSMVVCWLFFVKLFEVPVPIGSVWQAMGF